MAGVTAIVQLPAQSIDVLSRWWGHIEIRADGERVVVLLVLPNGGTMIARWGTA
jgi:hypothetical protein